MARQRRKKHIRKRIRGTEECPRLVVFRSLNHIYAQLIDDLEGKTLLTMASNSPQMQEKMQDSKSKIDRSFKLGQAVAEQAKERNIERVVFDRNGYIYHGRIKAVADGARKGGLQF